MQTLSFLIFGIGLGTFLGSLLVYDQAKKLSRDNREQLKDRYGYRVGEAIWKGSSFEELKAAVEQKEKYDD